MVAVVDLSKRYVTSEHDILALANIDVAVGEGEFVSLLGPSGCGKSTLLRIIAGLLPATSGRVEIGRRPISRL